MYAIQGEDDGDDVEAGSDDVCGRCSEPGSSLFQKLSLVIYLLVLRFTAAETSLLCSILTMPTPVHVYASKA